MLLVLSATLTTSSAWALDLEVSGLRVGQQLDVDASGAVPGETIHVVAGGPVGTGPCPPASGTCLDIEGPVILLGSAVADGGGVASVSVSVPATFPLGRVVGLQAMSTGAQPVKSDPIERISAESCTGSNVPGDYLSLADAVIALEPVGGTICLGPGVHIGSISPTPAADLTIVGTHRDETIIDGTCWVEATASFELRNVELTDGFEVDAGMPGETATLRDSRVLAGVYDSIDITDVASNTLIDGVEVSCEGATRGIDLETRDLLSVPDSVHTVQNSYIHGCDMGVSLDLHTADVRLVNNTFVDNLVGLDSWSESNGFVEYANNLFTDNEVAIDISIHSAGAVLAHHNALYGNTANYDGSALAGADRVTSDCLVSTLAPPEILPGSACEGAGDPTVAPATDYFGAPRAAVPDIGAAEL